MCLYVHCAFKAYHKNTSICAILKPTTQPVYDRTEFTEYQSFGSVGSRNTEPNPLAIFGSIFGFSCLGIRYIRYLPALVVHCTLHTYMYEKYLRHEIIHSKNNNQPQAVNYSLFILNCILTKRHGIHHNSFNRVIIIEIANHMNNIYIVTHR